MPKYVDCPFCGRNGLRTDEHVWAQWLRKTVGAGLLLKGTHGERVERPQGRYIKNQGGIYELASEHPGVYAKWLPNLVVPVCSDCNGGWMSKLEESVKRILGPLLFGEQGFVALSVTDLNAVATWATKCWMAYACTLDEQRNPFTIDEYRAMASDPAPLDRSTIWLMYAQEPRAFVGMAIYPTLLHPISAQPDLAEDRDNAAFAYLAASGAVLFMRLLPAFFPEPIAETLIPGQFAQNGIRRIWPAPRRQYFPLDTVSDFDFDLIMRFPHEVADAIGLPVQGMSDAQVSEVLRRFSEGEMPSELRKQWPKST